MNITKLKKKKKQKEKKNGRIQESKKKKSREHWTENCMGTFLVWIRCRKLFMLMLLYFSLSIPVPQFSTGDEFELSAKLQLTTKNKARETSEEKSKMNKAVNTHNSKWDLWILDWKEVGNIPQENKVTTMIQYLVQVPVCFTVTKNDHGLDLCIVKGTWKNKVLLLLMHKGNTTFWFASESQLLLLVIWFYGWTIYARWYSILYCSC